MASGRVLTNGISVQVKNAGCAVAGGSNVMPLVCRIADGSGGVGGPPIVNQRVDIQPKGIDLSRIDVSTPADDAEGSVQFRVNPGLNRIGRVAQRNCV